MVVKIRKHNLNEAYKEGLVGIWWYTDNGEFWDFSKTLDNAENDNGYLQYSTTKNHLNLWRKAVERFVKDKTKWDEIYNKGYKSIERGRVVYNVRTQCYEVVCSKELVNDMNFRKACKDYFGLNGNRVDFEALNHYCKQELTENTAIDNLYYDW